MHYYKILENKSFIGRDRELTLLREIQATEAAAIIVVAGRRRIGKTELIEQFFRGNKVIKLEGIQTERPRGRSHKTLMLKQIEACVHRLRAYNWEIPSDLECNSWTAFFEFISPTLESQPIIFYLEEIQWLCAYQDDLLAELKPFWDDRWRHNPSLRIVISGSSPSFIATQFMSNKAIYNRSDRHISLHEFSPPEVAAILPGRGTREHLIASLTVGGIPGYLQRFLQNKSILETLTLESFSRNGFFVKELDRIYISSLAESDNYRKIVETLAKQGSLTRGEIAKKVTGSTRAGGELSKILADLVSCGFLEEYPSVQNRNAQMGNRFRISDAFIHFFYHFIKPKIRDIAAGKFDNNPKLGLPERELSVYLGLSFERWVRKNTLIIAKKLGFYGVEFHAGSFFHKAAKGFQIDLLIERADHTLIVVEAKYATSPLKTTVASQVNEKIERMIEAFPKYKSYTIRKLLVVSDAAFVPLLLREQFDFMISAEDFFYN
jgi:hypothetical protein